MRNFNSCVYGPWRVRPVLRAHVAEGERVVAWGMTHRPATSSANLLAIAISMAPFIGPFLAPALMRREPRLLILTDRRLLFLRTDRKPANRRGRIDRSAVALEAPLDDVVVRASAGWFEVRTLSQGRRLRVEVPDQPGRPPERLRHALGLLATDDLSAGSEPGAGPEPLEPASATGRAGAGDAWSEVIPP